MTKRIRKRTPRDEPRETELLRARIELTALRDRDLDRQVANEWRHVDRETYGLMRLVE